MQAIKGILLLVMMVASQYAAAGAPVFGSSKETKYARELVPQKGKAIVYIYQRQQDGTGASPTIWLNNYEIGRIVPGSFTVWQLAPGRLELRVGSAEPATLSLMSQAGKVYLFRLSVTQSAGEAKAQLENMPDSYRGDLAATQFIKNPREVTPAVAQVPAPSTTPVTTAPVAKTTTPHRVRHEEALRAGGIGVLLKTGSLSLSKQTQTILLADRLFDKKATGLYGIEVYYQYDDGLAWGGELLGYKAHFITSGSTAPGDVAVHVVLANAKQYYRTETRLQPYLGVGMGAAVTDVSGAITGNSAGFAYQLVAGMEYRGVGMGAFLEAKYVGAKTKSGNAQTVDVTGSGLFAGIAFHF